VQVQQKVQRTASVPASCKAAAENIAAEKQVVATKAVAVNAETQKVVAEKKARKWKTAVEKTAFAEAAVEKTTAEKLVVAREAASAANVTIEKVRSSSAKPVAVTVESLGHRVEHGRSVHPTVEAAGEASVEARAEECVAMPIFGGCPYASLMDPFLDTLGTQRSRSLRKKYKCSHGCEWCRKGLKAPIRSCGEQQLANVSLSPDEARPRKQRRFGFASPWGLTSEPTDQLEDEEQHQSKRPRISFGRQLIDNVACFWERATGRAVQPTGSRESGKDVFLGEKPDT
jgi:hypothetical protein